MRFYPAYVGFQWWIFIWHQHGLLR